MKYNKAQRLQIYQWMFTQIDLVYEYGLCHTASLAIREIFGETVKALDHLKELASFEPPGNHLYWFAFSDEGNIKRSEIVQKCILMATPKSLVDLHPDCLSTCSGKFTCVDTCLKFKSEKIGTHVDCLRLGECQHTAAPVCENGCVLYKPQTINK